MDAKKILQAEGCECRNARVITLPDGRVKCRVCAVEQTDVNKRRRERTEGRILVVGFAVLMVVIILMGRWAS